MPRDADATRARILAAAVEEFAASGLAGGRVERIATAAQVNIKSVYQHFGSKEALFDAAVTDALGAVGTAVPFTEHDLALFAGRLFDAVCQSPQAHRLNLWRMLERPTAGPDDTALYAAKLAEVEAGPGEPVIAFRDLFVMVPAMATAWLNTSADLRSAAGAASADDARRRQFRASLVDAVQALVGGREAT